MGGYGKGFWSINSDGDILNYLSGYLNFYFNLVIIIEEDMEGNIWFGSFCGLNVWIKVDCI